MLVWLDLVRDSETVVLPGHLQLLAEKLLEAAAGGVMIIFRTKEPRDENLRMILAT